MYVHIASVRVLELNNLRYNSGAYASFHCENIWLYRKILLNRKTLFIFSIQLHLKHFRYEIYLASCAELYIDMFPETNFNIQVQYP